jgi:transglutaminase/protease-like cytokinesis protein 3
MFLFLIVVLFTNCSTLEGIFEQLSSALEGGQSSNNSATSTTRTTITTPSRNYTIPASYERAYSYRTDTPDSRMSRIPQNIEANRVNNPDEYIKQIVTLINDNSTDDFDRVKKAHDLVALSIRYDAANFWSGTVPDQNYQNVLKTRLAVCEGYANLFKKICDELNVFCEKVTGYARGVGSSPLADDKPNDSNHAWNLVTINGESYLVDCTWNSGYMDGRVSRQRYTTDYLFLKPEHIIHTHFPQNPRHQLLATQLTASQYSTLPFLKPKFFELSENISFNLQKINNVEKSLILEYIIKDGYRLSFQVNDIRSNREVQNSTFVQRDGLKETAYFSFPTAGQYSVSIFWWETGARQGSGCGEFVVQTTSSSIVQYPTVFASSAENLLIINPIEMPLERGSLYNFQVRVDNRNFVAIIHGRTFVQLTRNSDGIFSLEFEIPANINTLSIGVASSERGQYQTIAQYQVR